LLFDADNFNNTTYHHSQVTVTLTDGRKLLATVKGADELTDLAVLQIEGSGASSSSTSTSHSHLFGGGSGTSSSSSSSSSTGHQQLMADATFPAAKLGNSEDLSVGDWVIAVSSEDSSEESSVSATVTATAAALRVFKDTRSNAIHHPRYSALHALQAPAAARVDENWCLSCKAAECCCSVSSNQMLTCHACQY
jgi:Trypsin-like peptidase domain